MNLETVTARIKKHEGCVLHCYEDHLGYMTIGVGRLIDKKKGGGITEDEAEYLLKNDIKRVMKYLDTHLLWWREQPKTVQHFLIEFVFQLGIGNALKFQNALGALQNNDMETACNEFRDSLWHRQTTARAEEMISTLESVKT